jgi:predicted nucleic acid-binding protein
VVVADSSVWIDFFNAAANPARDVLRRLLHEGDTRIVVPDLVLFEVLRGFRHERDLRQARMLMTSLDIEEASNADCALEAAEHYRDLRKSGVTVRSGIDVLVATFCIRHDYLLLHRDRDFQAFEARRGLRGWKH